MSVGSLGNDVMSRIFHQQAQSSAFDLCGNSHQHAHYG